MSIRFPFPTRSASNKSNSNTQTQTFVYILKIHFALWAPSLLLLFFVNLSFICNFPFGTPYEFISCLHFFSALVHVCVSLLLLNPKIYRWISHAHEIKSRSINSIKFLNGSMWMVQTYHSVHIFISRSLSIPRFFASAHFSCVFTLMFRPKSDSKKNGKNCLWQACVAGLTTTVCFFPRANLCDGMQISLSLFFSEQMKITTGWIRFVCWSHNKQ